MFVIPGPREKFSETEINHMKKYLEVKPLVVSDQSTKLSYPLSGQGGGSILVMLGEGGENRFGTNINFLLEE